MYSLTLSKDERRVIDFVGDRYFCGYELYRILWIQSTQIPDNIDWDEDGDVTFEIPEYLAWEIMEKIEEEGMPVFGSSLKYKIYDFISQIV